MPYSSYLFTTCFLSFPYLPWDSFLLRHPFSIVPIPRLFFTEPSRSRSYASYSKYSLCVTSVIRHLFLPSWHQAVDSSLGVGLLRPFPSSRARTEGRTFIDNHIRWSEQGLLWGIDSGDHGHYSASRAWCLRTRPDSSLSVMETLDSTELFMEDQTWLDYLWDFETRGINLDLPSDTD